MKKRMAFAGYVSFALALAAPAWAAVGPKLLLQKSADLPVTTFNLTFRVGSADDPAEAAGLANMTARLLREGGVRAAVIDGVKMPARKRAEIEDVLFPLAADIDVSAETEQTSFRVTTAASDAKTVFNILAQLIVAPAFEAAEFERLKAEELDALTKQLPREDQEELGKAALYQKIYGAGHPYSHVTQGTVQGVRALTLEKVQTFYKTHFTQQRLTVAMAGVVKDDLARRARSVFAKLPAGDSDRAKISPARQKGALHLTLVKGPFDATGVHLGEPLAANRASAESADLLLASWAFGKHRSFVGRLMKSVREVRGLNYGTYSYVEDFPGGGHYLSPPTQTARSYQAFTVWGRPTTPENGCFLLRQLYREVNNLAAVGLTKAEFDLTQSHLVGNAPLLATGLERRLGYAVDSEFYGITGDYLAKLQGQAKRSKLKKVNALLGQVLHPKQLDIVVVTRDPEAFKAQILGERCDIHYAAGVEKPTEVLEEDKIIATYPLGLKPENIEIVSSEAIFEK